MNAALGSFVIRRESKLGNKLDTLLFGGLIPPEPPRREYMHEPPRKLPMYEPLPASSYTAGEEVLCLGKYQGKILFINIERNKVYVKVGDGVPTWENASFVQKKPKLLH